MSRRAVRPAAQQSRRRLAALLFCAVLVAGLLTWRRWPREPSADVLLPQALEKLQHGEFDAAQHLAERALRQVPQSIEGHLLAGRAAAAASRHAQAATHFDSVPVDDPLFAPSQCAAGDAWRELGKLHQAELHFRRALQREPDLADAHDRMEKLMLLEGRAWEQRGHLSALVKQPVLSADRLTRVLLGLAQYDRFAGSETELEQCRQASPQDAEPLLGLAILQLRAGRLNEAEPLLRRCLELNPQLVEAEVQLGMCLAQQGDDPAWLRWRAACSPATLAHPGCWQDSGEWLQQKRWPEGAIRCYWEALRRDPDRLSPNLRLAQLLEETGRAELSTPFAERGRLLSVLEDEASRLIAFQGAEDGLTRARRTAIVQSLAETTEALGRLREACIWRGLQSRYDPADAPARQAFSRLRGLLDERLPLTAATSQPAWQVDFSELEMPDWSAISEARRVAAAESRIAFSNDASSAGIDFRYENGRRQGQPGRIRESLGGGVAVLDYDQDGWPDLYFTQGCLWPPEEMQAEHRDQLYRNLGDGRFLNVTQQAGLGDNRYSQGVAAGDFDNDGWPDLYVANLGLNRLYRNAGNGVFHEVPAVPGMTETWTASCLIADLNGDGIPDLYDATYVGGPDVHERTCGHRQVCSPLVFEALTDRLWLGRGDGRFVDRSSQAGIPATDGNGLGIVAADFDGSGRLGLYVANDQKPNFLFVNQTPRRGAEIKLTERGVIAGAALSGEGRPQGSMGIAIADADGDGTLDLFVTNFIDEPNTLYLRQGPGLSFIDATPRSGLAAASRPMVGFGTQFLDADLDGWPDLIVANGDVDDYSAQGRKFQQRPQFFRNEGQAEFRELPAESLGPFFQGEYLGRGLSRLDWNLDGREDVVISHIGEPAALLTNRTTDAGHFLGLQFRGVESERDAIGVTVQLLAGGRTRVGQLTAGDGYMASNQRQLIFGLGEIDRIETLTIRWPAGSTQTFHDLPCDRTFLLIEGANQPQQLHVQQ